MLKRAVSGIMISFLLISMLTLAFNIQLVNAQETIYIRADGSIDPPTAPISTPDNITYTLTDNITSSQDGIVIERDNIVIDGTGHTLQGIGSGNGTLLENRKNVTITNMEIEKFAYGISLYGTSGSSIVGNNATTNGFSIFFFSSSNNTVEENNVSSSLYWGIRLDSSSNNTISRNNVKATINWDGIRLHSSNNNTVSENQLVANNGAGIYLAYSSNNKIKGNNATASEQGIMLDYSSDNTLIGNTLTGNMPYGILAYHSNNNNITGNIMASQGPGIMVTGSADNSVSGNNMTANDAGIQVTYFSSNNTFSENNVMSNNYGIYFDGISDNNTMYHNNFAGNTHQVFMETTITGKNATEFWDNGYPSGGNYWSNYVGTDLLSGSYQNETGSDGIGDKPYVINENNRDNYPLMKPYPWSSHDIGITSVAASKTVVGQGYNMSIEVMAFNYGNNTENLNITIYADSTIIGEIKNIDIASRNFSIISITWNTTGFAKGNYTIKAVADTVWGEVDVGDNNMTDGWIIVAMAGDIIGSPDGYPDGICDMKDIRFVAKRFGIDPTNLLLWDPNADVVEDNFIDMKDIRAVAKHFGETYP